MVVGATVVVVVAAVIEVEVDPVDAAGVTNCTRVAAGPWVAITATVAAPAKTAAPIAIRIRPCHVIDVRRRPRSTWCWQLSGIRNPQNQKLRRLTLYTP